MSGPHVPVPPPMPGQAGAREMPHWSGEVPAKLASAMRKEKKPFTYTPAGITNAKGLLDLTEIRSPRMKKRLLKNVGQEHEDGDGLKSDAQQKQEAETTSYKPALGRVLPDKQVTSAPQAERVPSAPPKVVAPPPLVEVPPSAGAPIDWPRFERPAPQEVVVEQPALEMAVPKNVNDWRVAASNRITTAIDAAIGQLQQPDSFYRPERVEKAAPVHVIHESVPQPPVSSASKTYKTTVKTPSASSVLQHVLDAGLQREIDAFEAIERAELAQQAIAARSKHQRPNVWQPPSVRAPLLLASDFDWTEDAEALETFATDF